MMFNRDRHNKLISDDIKNMTHDFRFELGSTDYDLIELAPHKFTIEFFGGVDFNVIEYFFSLEQSYCGYVPTEMTIMTYCADEEYQYGIHTCKYDDERLEEILKYNIVQYLRLTLEIQYEKRIEIDSEYLYYVCVDENEYNELLKTGISPIHIRTHLTFVKPKYNYYIKIKNKYKTYEAKYHYENYCYIKDFIDSDDFITI